MGEVEEDEGSGSGLEAWLADDVNIHLLCFDPDDAHQLYVHLAFK
jgi:hypothetical protein